MKERFHIRSADLISAGSVLLPMLLFWIVLAIGIPPAFSQLLRTYSLGLFLSLLILYYLSFRLPNELGRFACLGLTMILLSLSLSYLWTSGFSDNFIIGGLLPYKDGKNYYVGANMILNGIPPLDAGQATERPLFPGFLAFLLFVTGGSLKISIAILGQLAGVGLYVAARQIRNSFGALAASYFATFMYIHSGIGYTMSETLGVLVGCFGFAVIWLVSYNPKWHDLLLGLFTLMVAVSARAGAFFIFPMLAVWAGWIFRGEKRFSLKMTFYTLVAVLLGYLLVNSIYSRLLGIPPGHAFGNFSYAIYGQVRGGLGWSSAIRELGTRNPSTVYRAALEFFLDHPISLFIGFAKSYRDFFLFGDRSIFPFSGQGWQYWANLFLWLGTVTLLVLGLIQLCRTIRLNLSSLLLAGFIGIFLSIPFLPPIDGGSRFYASSRSFFFVIPAIGVSRFSREARQIITSANGLHGDLVVSRFFSVAILVLTVIAPPVIFSLGQKPAHTPPVCPARQEPFVLEFHKGSYIDLVKDGTSECGMLPKVCFDDFAANNAELQVDDFYQELLFLSEGRNVNARIISAMDWVKNQAHYFYIPLDQMPGNVPSGLISGCAVEINTQFQSIYQVLSIVPEAK